MSLLQIQDKWIKTKFGDIVLTVNENEFNPLQNGIQKYVGGEHIESENLHVTKFGDIKTSKYVLGSAFHRRFFKGDILFGTRRAYLRKAAIATFDGICANTTLVLRAKNNYCVKELLPFIVQWEKFTEFAISRSVGSTNPYVRWRDLADFEFYLPSLNEQKRISELFWSVQKSIDSLEDLIQKFKIYKESKANNLLTQGIGHTKFKKAKWLFGKEIKIPEEWCLDEIQNHAKITTGSKNTQDKIKNGKFPFFVRSQTIKKINSYSFDGEAVLTVGDGKIGEIIHYVNGKFDFHQRVYKISNFDNKLNGYYFYYYFKKHFLKRALSMNAKNTVDSVRRDMIAKMEILLPSILEQQKIASILSKLDEQYKQLENHSSLLKTMRKSMVNKKLTPPTLRKKIVQ